MVKITSNLSGNLRSVLRNADEVWIAVALLNLKGVEFIFSSVKTSCKMNFIIGIDLPTDPAALTKLIEKKAIYTISAYILTKKIFHPKVYIVNTGRQTKCFVGSANCTNGGLNSNIEMTIEISEQEISRQLNSWFIKVQEDSQTLTTEFIADYLPKYERRLNRKKEDYREIQELKEKTHKKFEANLEERNSLISRLGEIRRSIDYPLLKQTRQEKIRDLKIAIDYPNFKELDLSAFWKIRDLGTIVPIRLKAIIENDRPSFRKLMKFICDDRIPITKRINEALEGKLAIENIGEGFITKILVIHNPKEYFIQNKEFKRKFSPFGISFPKGLSIGGKYQLTKDALQSILKETNIDDFATLDECLLRI